MVEAPSSSSQLLCVDAGLRYVGGRTGDDWRFRLFDEGVEYLSDLDLVF